MTVTNTDPFRQRLIGKKSELEERLRRITANVRRPLNADSKEQAKQLEDQEVVDALGNEARTELAKVNEALERLESGSYGSCSSCATLQLPRSFGGSSASAAAATATETSRTSGSRVVRFMVQPYRANAPLKGGC